MNMIKTRCFEWLRWGMLVAVMAWTAVSVAQESTNPPQPASVNPPNTSVSDSVRELREQVRELQAAVAGMRSDWQRAREETAEMRRELDEIRTRETPVGAGSGSAVLRNAIAKLESGTSESAGNLPSAMPNGAIQDQKEIQK